MSFFGFGKRPEKGISEYELKSHGNRLTNRLHAAFTGSRESKERKREILDAALHMSGDKDYGAPSSQHGGVVTREEFEGAVNEYEKDGLFSKDEAKRLRDSANDALNS